MTIDINYSAEKNALTIQFSDSLTYADWQEFRAKCLGINYPKVVTLDFCNLNEMNVAGLSMIMFLHERLQESQSVMVMKSCNEQVRKLMDCMEIDQKLKKSSKIAHQFATA